MLRIISDKDLPFYREVHRLIKKYPKYLKGIREGKVHIKFRPGCAPEEGKPEPVYPTTEA